MQTYLIYLLIFAVGLGLQAYCEYKGYVFQIGLICFALGVVGAIGLGRFEAHRGSAAMIVGSALGFLFGSYATATIAIVVWSPYNAVKWLQKRRRQ